MLRSGPVRIWDCSKQSSATAGGSERGFHFVLHNSSLSLDPRRPAVRSSARLDHSRRVQGSRATTRLPKKGRHKDERRPPAASVGPSDEVVVTQNVSARRVAVPPSQG